MLYRSLLTLGALGLCVGWLVLAPPRAGAALPPVAQGPALPLTATLTMPTVPGVGQPAPLFITVGSVREAPQTEVTLELPEGATATGPTSWQVALTPGATAHVTTTIQFGRTGQQELLVHLRSPIDANNALIGEGALGVTIGERSGQVGFGEIDARDGATPTPSPTPAGERRCLTLPLAGLAGLSLLRRRLSIERKGGLRRS